jgi:hypothetical protein
MSEIQIVTNFELLPNEILIECFEYLNAVDIFYSFDQLNYRFNKLIRNILLYLDFRNVSKSTFDKFCMKISLNPEIKKQIYSLKLSNKDICYQIQPFLSRFSLDEFSHLQLLTLIEVKEHNIPQLKLILPFLSQLVCFRLIDSEDQKNEILSILPISKLRTLMISKLPLSFKLICYISSITNLTISKCYLNGLHQILKNTSRLKYLNAQHIDNFEYSMMNKDEYSTNHHAIHLKQLIIKKFEGEFSDLVMILKQTPNLKILIIDTHCNIDMIDASQWQHLITSSLPYLNIFKFNFICDNVHQINYIHEKLKLFQNDFWQKQHQWYNEYLLTGDSILIYTIPYISDTYILTPFMNRYYNKSMNNFNTFDNVTDLTIHPNVMREKCQYHFSHVISMTLGDQTPFINNFSLDEKHIESLKIIVNLSSVKHLEITCHCYLKTPSVLLEILKQAPQLCSININWLMLKSLLDDDELCKYLTKMITKFHISDYTANILVPFYDIDLLWKIFPNIEQFKCLTEQKEFILFLLKYLPKLSCINAYSCSNSFIYPISWLEEEAEKLGLKIITDSSVIYYSQLSIWIVRDMH